MSEDPQLQRLFELCVEAIDRGETPDVEQVCRDCPELQPQLRDLVGRYKSVGDVFEVPDEQEPERPAAPMDVDQLQPGDIPWPNEDWQLVEKLGEGGFAVVWKAHHRDLKSHQVVLKILRNLPVSDDWQMLRQSLVREAGISLELQKVGVQGIVAVHQHRLHASSPYIVLDYVECQNLSQHLGTVNGHVPRLTPDDAFSIVYDLTQILAACHKEGITHNDLKPANILVTETGVLPKLYLTDFGIGSVIQTHQHEHLSRLTHHSQLSLLGQRFYTDGYDAKERFDKSVDKKTRLLSGDVYAIGIIWAQMLLGDFTKRVRVLVTEENDTTQWSADALGISVKQFDLINSCSACDHRDRPKDAVDLMSRIGNVYSDRRSAISYFKQGNVHDTLSEYSESIADYTRAIEIDPEYAAAYHKRGAAFSEIGKDNEAIRDCSKMTALDPECDGAFFIRGVSFFKTGDHANAIDDYTQVIRITPENAVAYYCRGNAHRANGEHRKAIADYTHAINLGVSNWASDVIGNIYFWRGLEHGHLAEYADAVDDFGRTLEIMPSHTQVHKFRGTACLELGRYAMAIEDCTRAIEINSELAPTYNIRGCAYNEIGEYHKAIDDYTRAIEIQPNYVLAFQNRGYSYYELGEHSKAIEDYTQAIEIAPDDFGTYDLRGCAYRALGDQISAIFDHTRAIEIMPNEPMALSVLYFNRGNAYQELGVHSRAQADHRKSHELADNSKDEPVKDEPAKDKVPGKDEPAEEDSETPTREDIKSGSFSSFYERNIANIKVNDGKATFRFRGKEHRLMFYHDEIHNHVYGLWRKKDGVWTGKWMWATQYNKLMGNDEDAHIDLPSMRGAKEETKKPEARRASAGLTQDVIDQLSYLIDEEW